MLHLFACAGPTVPTSPAGDSAIDSPVDTRTEWERVAAQYGVLTTVAGKGDIDGKSQNGWDEAYEGGSALDAELSRPHMTLADADDNLYIADKDAHAIRKVDTDGVITTIAGTGGPGDDGDGYGPDLRLHSPNGIWVLDDGTVYIHDMGNDKVRRLDPDGQMTTLFDTTGSSTGRGLWVADDESLAYVACGNVVRKWTPEEGVERLAAGFSSLGNLVVDPNGDVVATDRSGHTVHRITPDGDKELIAGNETTRGGGDGEPATETGLAEVRGVWFHELGGYFLATHMGGDIWYVDTDGVIHLFIEGDDEHSHSGDGEAYDTPGLKISEPRAITMFDDGRLILTENDHGFVRVVELAE